MDIKAKNSITNIVNLILPLVLIIEYLTSVFSNISFLLNILAVILIMAIYLYLLSKRSVQKLDIFIILITLVIIIAMSDVTMISLLCFYVLFSLRQYFNKRTLKNCLIATALSISIIVICYLLFGLNKHCDTQIYRPLSGKTVSRMCFGFRHPNQFTIYLLALTILVYMSTDKLRVHTFITAIDIVFFYFTQSRTMLYVILFIYISMLLVKFFKLRFVKNYTFMPAVYLFFIVISIVLSIFFAGTKLDVILTGRLAINKNYLGSVSLFGTDAYDNTYFDNSYVHMIVTKGLIYTAVYSALFVVMLYKTKFSWKNVVILTAIFLEAFMEVIFLKYSFLIIIPLICKDRINFKYGTEKNSLLLVRQSAKI